MDMGKTKTKLKLAAVQQAEKAEQGWVKFQ